MACSRLLRAYSSMICAVVRSRLSPPSVWKECSSFAALFRSTPVSSTKAFARSTPSLRMTVCRSAAFLMERKTSSPPSPSLWRKVSGVIISTLRRLSATRRTGFAKVRRSFFVLLSARMVSASWETVRYRLCPRTLSACETDASTALTAFQIVSSWFRLRFPSGVSPKPEISFRYPARSGSTTRLSSLAIFAY